ncbi:hypothetical protein R6Z07M_019112 [Ovis aries]
MSAQGPGWAAPRPAGGSEDRGQLAAASGARKPDTSGDTPRPLGLAGSASPTCPWPFTPHSAQSHRLPSSRPANQLALAGSGVPILGSPQPQPLPGLVAGAPTPAAALGYVHAACEPLRIPPGNQITVRSHDKKGSVLFTVDTRPARRSDGGAVGPTPGPSGRSAFSPRPPPARRAAGKQEETAPGPAPRGPQSSAAGRSRRRLRLSPAGPTRPPLSAPRGRSRGPRVGDGSPRGSRGPMPPQQGDPAFPGRCEAPPVPPRRERGGRGPGAPGGRGRAGGAEGRGVKCVLVGDGAVGKTSLVVSYTTNGYPTEYIPTAFDNFSAVVSVDGRPVKLQLCDTAGQDEFDKLRPLCYTNADIFLLCFSVVGPSSFQNVSEKWVPEIRCHCPKAPIILVGTQSDLREDVKVLIELDKCKEKPVPEEAARLCAEEIKATSYIECSALTQKNLKEVFDAAIVAGIQYSDSQQQPKNSKSRTPDKMKTLSKSWWKKYCCFV